MRPFLVAAMLLFSSPLRLLAQEVGYIDTTDNLFRESTRTVRTFSGGCGGSPPSTQKPQPEVTVTLVSLDKSRYQVGEEVTFEIRVLNSGKETIAVPWTPHRGDLEPSDPKAPYRYRVGVVVLIFSDPEGLQFVLADTLYGSPRVPGSLRELSPGQWFSVKGRKKIALYSGDWGKRGFADSGFVETKVSAFYRQDTGSYSPKNGGWVGEMCIPLPCRKANEVDVILERP